MVVRRIFVAAYTLALVGICSSASAQSSTTIHGVGSVSVGYTDNMQGSPSDPESGDPEPMDVVFLEVSPGLSLIHDGPRALHMLSYLHPFTIYFGHGDATSQSDIGAWRSLFTLSPRDELTLGLTIERSNTRLGNLQANADQSVASSQMGGNNILLQSHFTQGYSHQHSAQWTLTQTAGAGSVIPLDVGFPQPYRYEGRIGFVPEYTVHRNAFALLADATYFYATEVNEGGVHAESVAQLVLSGQFRWRHDLSPAWSTELSGGFAGAMRADPIRGGVWGPIALGAIRYDEQGYGAELMVHRSLGPDLITSQTLMADHVLLSGGLPIDRENNIVLRTGAGYTHNRTLQVEESGFMVAAPFATPNSTDNARLITTYDTWVVDTSVGWYPEDLPHVLLRYQHLEQIGEESQVAPALTFRRNLAILTVGMTWPSREVPAVPEGQAERVDQSDRDDRLNGEPRGGRSGRPRNN